MLAHELDIDPGGRYSVIEAAKLLGIAPSTLHRWITEGKIKHHVHRITGKRFLLGRHIRAYWMAYQ